MPDTIEHDRAIEADTTVATNSLMAPEFALLRDVQMPMNPLSPPSIRTEGSNVFINIVTIDSANSPEYKSAIAHLQARGCKVRIDRDRAESFVHIEIIAPHSLFSLDAISTLEAKHDAEEIRTAQARKTRVAVPASILEWNC